jgi:hypothetical protein
VTPLQDPEGLFKTGPAPGIIERKLMGQRIQSDQEAKASVDAFVAAEKADLERKRNSRVVPEDAHDLVEYFLGTDATDMEFEVARCRPALTKDFFAVLDRLVGVERFSSAPDEDRLAELEYLRQYLTEGLEAVDKAAAATAAPVERLKKLLAAKDKKAALLEMAAANEIDQGLMDLLAQNIEGATEAGQTEAAEFMTKVQQAVGRYMI